MQKHAQHVQRDVPPGSTLGKTACLSVWLAFGVFVSVALSLQCPIAKSTHACQLCMLIHVVTISIHVVTISIHVVTISICVVTRRFVIVTKDML